LTASANSELEFKKGQGKEEGRSWKSECPVPELNSSGGPGVSGWGEGGSFRQRERKREAENKGTRTFQWLPHMRGAVEICERGGDKGKRDKRGSM